MMSDAPVVIATIGTCVALLSCAMSWLALQHSILVQKSYKQLHKEFWRQSIVQAEQNRKLWLSQVQFGENVSFILDHLSLPQRPQDPPLH